MQQAGQSKYDERQNYYQYLLRSEGIAESVYLMCQNNDWICLLQVTLNFIE